jgi:6-phosphofructokinase 1
MKNIAILCSGGDVSGMNAALKRFVEYMLELNLNPFFIKRGYEGLIDDEIYQVSYQDVSGIITKGGTIIKSARSKRFLETKYRQMAIANLKKHNIDGVVVLGGDGSFRGMHKISQECDISFVGIPSTIDNDISHNQYCLGVDTALNIIKSAIDSIRDTASSFQRAFVIETMGRECGYLALISALTSGAEMCLIPEVRYDLDSYKKRFLQEKQNSRDYFIAIVSEALNITDDIAKWFQDEIGIEARVTILGHIQRGGNPSVYDRLMAYKFVTKACDTLLEGSKEAVVCYNDGGFLIKDINEIVDSKYQISDDLLSYAKSFQRV